MSEIRDELLTFSISAKDSVHIRDDRCELRERLPASSAQPLDCVEIAEGAERVYATGQRVLTSHRDGYVSLGNWPLQHEMKTVLFGKIVAVYPPTHFFLEESFRVHRYAFSDGKEEAIVSRDVVEDKVFAVSSGEIVVASGKTICLWSVTDKETEQTKEWTIPKQHQMDRSEIVDAKKAGDVVALVRQFKESLVEGHLSHCMLYFHPDRADPESLRCSNPCLSVVDSVFMRISSGSTFNRERVFVFKTRDVSHYIPATQDFPEETQAEDIAPIGPVFCDSKIPQAPIRYGVRVHDAEGERLILKYGPANKSGEPYRTDFLTYSMGNAQQRQWFDMGEDFDGKLRLVGDGKLLVFQSSRVALWCVTKVEHEGQWDVEYAKLGDKVTDCEIIDADANAESVVALVRYKQTPASRDHYCLYSMLREDGFASDVTSSLRPRERTWGEKECAARSLIDVSKTTEPHPPLGTGKRVVAALSLLVTAYGLIRVWARKGQARKTPPAPAPSPMPTLPLPSRPLSGPPVRRPRGKILKSRR